MDNNEKPLVTFALFAYNQEDYIREAIEGAFSQTYEPLEIILSDDCSTDRTFEIMQEMAAAYEGSHEVKVRQNQFNLGTALHVQSVFMTSAGQLFVVAAGDDISRDNRVAALFDTWIAAGQPEGTIHSGREVFRGNDVIKILPAKKYKFTGNELAGYLKDYWLPVAAPTCAYTRGVFENFDPLFGGSVIEDAPLFLRSALIGKFVACQELLVLQRMHENNTGTGYNIHTPVRWNRFIQSKVIAFRNMQNDLKGYVGEIDSFVVDDIEKRILKVIRSTSGLIISQKRNLSVNEKFKLALRIVTSSAVAGSFRLRFEFMLSFYGFSFHERVKSQLGKKILNKNRLFWREK